MRPETADLSSARLARLEERERGGCRGHDLLNGRPKHSTDQPEQRRQRGTSTFAVWAVAAMLAGACGVQRPCFAGESEIASKASRIFDALAGAAVPDAELGRQPARGIANFPIAGVLSNGVAGGNAFLAPIVTGAVTTTGSVSNNTGSTTGFQNSGINSSIQQTISVNMTR